MTMEGVPHTPQAHTIQASLRTKQTGTQCPTHTVLRHSRETKEGAQKGIPLNELSAGSTLGTPPLQGTHLHTTGRGGRLSKKYPNQIVP